MTVVPRGITGVVVRPLGRAAGRDGHRHLIAVGAVVPGRGSERPRLDRGVGMQHVEAEVDLHRPRAPAGVGEVRDDLRRPRIERRPGDVLIESPSSPGSGRPPRRRRPCPGCRRRNRASAWPPSVPRGADRVAVAPIEAGRCAGELRSPGRNHLPAAGPERDEHRAAGQRQAGRRTTLAPCEHGRGETLSDDRSGDERSRDGPVWESGAMRRLLTGFRMTLGYLATLVATAVRRPFRAPARPSWTVGDEARARYVRAFWRRLQAMPRTSDGGSSTRSRCWSRAHCCGRNAAARRLPACP